MTDVRRLEPGRQLVWPSHWRRFIVALVLLIWADLASTMAAARVLGLSAEANPVMRWLLAQDLAIVLLVHCIIFLVALGAFAGVVRIGLSLDGRRADWYRIGCSLWITGMIIVGLVVVLNNLALTLVVSTLV